MTFRLAATSLGKSVLAGGAVAALAATAAVASLMVPIVDNWQDAAEIARLLGSVAAFAFGTVAGGVLLVGLPTTFVLRQLNRESEQAYVIAGTAFGILLPIVPGGGYWMSTVGAAAGAVVALVWWQTYRRHVAEAE